MLGDAVRSVRTLDCAHLEVSTLTVSTQPVCAGDNVAASARSSETMAGISRGMTRPMYTVCLERRGIHRVYLSGLCASMQLFRDAHSTLCATSSRYNRASATTRIHMCLLIV